MPRMTRHKPAARRARIRRSGVASARTHGVGVGVRDV
jgi:hypothetical protein